ncbi:hypothetical protein HK099_005318 [Clydaea vesicula]|uniref:Holo-[acyl-carrier-protein] synthase n=1 Tax=Clydaea vesicula TaxID=447962 RepID=A0AAD5U173_9FUNG|nr:hypothetical protein HK099_005318 [Clydaea vesicula]
MILGIGNDLVLLSRFKLVADRVTIRRLAKRILTEHEQEVLFSVNSAYKALFGHYKLSWKDVEIRKVNGKPDLFLSDNVRKLFDYEIKGFLSISHDGEYLLANVLFEKTREPV